MLNESSVDGHGTRYLALRDNPKWSIEIQAKSCS